MPPFTLPIIHANLRMKVRYERLACAKTQVDCTVLSAVLDIAGEISTGFKNFTASSTRTLAFNYQKQHAQLQRTNLRHLDVESQGADATIHRYKI